MTKVLSMSDIKCKSMYIHKCTIKTKREKMENIFFRIMCVTFKTDRSKNAYSLK